jgi:dienelactone hydrolase
MRILALAVALFCLAQAVSFVQASSPEKQAEKGAILFKPVDDQKNVPERYRLGDYRFEYELTPKYELTTSGVDVYHLCFPSPVTSPYPENNTVHADYYRPRGAGPFPAVVVLDITAGDQLVSRSIATHLARNQIAALFVQMAYYGPRRPPGSNLRLLSLNFKQTFDAIRQTVLDVRCAAAWLAARPEADPRRLGIVGTSLGSFMGALAAEMEPRLNRVVVLLGGGGLVDGFYDHPRAAAFREFWEALGGNKERLAQALAPVDPLTCAANLKDHKLLIIAGKRDDVVPPRMSLALWKAAGEQQIVWYDCTHLGAALYFAPALDQVIRHLRTQ